MLSLRSRQRTARGSCSALTCTTARASIAETPTRRKRTLDGVGTADTAAVGSLIGVCADGVDENSTIRDIMNGFMYSKTVITGNMALRRNCSHVPHSNHLYFQANGAVLSHTLRSLRPFAQNSILATESSEDKTVGAGLICLLQKIPSPATAPVFQEVKCPFTVVVNLF